MSQFTISNLRGNDAQPINPTTGPPSGDAPAFAVASRPRAMGAASLRGQTLETSDYAFQTAQECDVLARGACEPMSSYTKDPQRGALIYEPTGFGKGKPTHRLELTQESPEIGGDIWEMDALSQLVESVNADFGFAFFYVCGLLAPKTPLPADRAAVSWIDLDDVAAKIGYDVSGSTAAQREEMRAQVWQFMLFGARAVVIGQRSTEYPDKVTGKIIETRVESPVWSIMETERPIQTAFSFDARFRETPRRVRLALSKSWEPLLTVPQLALYLPFAEIVGSIPTNQTAGAWARVIGMALANLWRRKPHEAAGVTKLLLPMRSELLTRYTPKANTQRTKSPLEILQSDKPKRAVKYWLDALGILRTQGFIANEGEAEKSRTVADMLQPFGRQGWQSDWLMECVDLRPGPKVDAAIKERAAAKPVRKLRDSSAPKRGARKS